jgi:type IV secretion system protein VirB11
MASVAAQGIYLQSFLSPLVPFLEQDDVTDLFVNRPGEVWIETLGGAIARHYVGSLDDTLLSRLAQQIAAFAHQGINREHPLLAATLPGGERVQIAAPPVTRGPLALAIRKHIARDLTLDDYAQSGAFAGMGDPQLTEDVVADLRALRARGDSSGLLRHAVQSRLNIVVAGGTATGKTTFLNVLIGEIDEQERLILIEDTPELNMRHDNAVGLVAARSMLGEAAVTAEDLLNASLRMRPDRIILGELRGPEAFTFLRAINTGHPGSMTTIHADSPARAIEQIALLVLQTGTKLDRDSIVHYVRSSIDVFVQLGRMGGKRHVIAIALRGEV